MKKISIFLLLAFFGYVFILDVEKTNYEKSKYVQVGDTCREFTQNDNNGVPVSLSSYRGKYVLLQFWSSRSGKCRGENTNLVTAYFDYKDKGLIVLSVSLDTSKREWDNAIDFDHLYWTNISDLNGLDNKVAKIYNIKHIPYNFIIDPNGIVIAKDLQSDSLLAFLKRTIK